MDERPEEDEGYVTLVNAREKKETWKNAPNAPIYGPGSIPTATARSPTPA